MGTYEYIYNFAGGFFLIMMTSALKTTINESSSPVFGLSEWRLFPAQDVHYHTA